MRGRAVAGPSSRTGGERPTDFVGAGDGKLRVLYVECNEDGTVGGSHQVLYDFLRYVDRDRVEPVVLYYQENPFCERLERIGVEVLSYEEIRELERRRRNSASLPVKYFDFLAAVTRRLRTIRHHDIDLVHLANTPTVGYDDWLPACRWNGTPCVANAMGRVPDDLGPVKNFLVRQYDRVLASSTQVATSLRNLGVRESVDVLPLGVDIEGFRRRAASSSPKEIRTELGLPSETVLGIMVGHVRPWKGQHLVLEAVASLPPDVRRRFTLLLVGDISDEDGGYGQRMAERTREDDLRDCVQYLGRRDDVPRLLAASDIAIHASCEPEPFGLVIVEAMALGLPVIAADRGGPLDILDGDSGDLVDPSDTDALGRTLRYLVENPEARRRMGRAARRRAEKFDIRNYAAGIEAVYDRLLGTGPRTASVERGAAGS